MENSSGRLYRILKFQHAAQIFTRKTLRFTRPELWEDPYEKTLEKLRKTDVFAQCWCSQAASDAMWRIYSPDHLSVRISTTTKKLREALNSKNVAKQYNFIFRDVCYLPQYEFNIKTRNLKKEINENYSIEAATEMLFFKRNPFNHESEFRVIAIDNHEKSKTLRTSIELPVDPHKLIDSILIDPRAPDELVDALSMYFTEKIGFKKRVSKSALYKSPKHISERD